MGQGRLSNIQATSGPDNLWPEVWSNMSQTISAKSKAGMGEKRRLEAACQLRG